MIIETDVLVVGAGLTGLTATNILARAGVSAITLSRYEGPAHTPRASVTNARTMEVYRDLGVEERIANAGTRLVDVNFNVMATTLDGLELARYKSYGTPPERLSDYAAASPCHGVNAHQLVTEPILLDEARQRGADIRYMQEVVSLEQNDEYASAQVTDRTSGQTYEIRAKWVIAADGANSPIASAFGFEFLGDPGEKLMSNCWLEVDLAPYVEHRPGVIFWTGQPGLDTWFGSGSWILVTPWNEWSFIYPLHDNSVPSEEEVIERARLTIGDPKADVKVKALTTWAVQNVVATEYRKGRVFLAGDAAHRHPPTGGLGANTSIQDAFNLAWKLTAVVRGQAGEGLLDSYSAERQPIGAQIVDRAIESFHNLAAVVTALGLEQNQSAEEGWAAIHQIYEGSPEGAARRADLQKAIELQQYRSNAIGVELGQRYSSCAVFNDGTPFPAPTRDPDLYYEPTTHPGAYLPHAWIEHNRKQISTIDLVGRDRFTLIVGLGGGPWMDAASQVAAEYGLDLRIVKIGLRSEYDDVVGEWENVREVSDEGALLVRPDRYIAWRSHGLSADPAAEITRALDHVLAREDLSI